MRDTTHLNNIILKNYHKIKQFRKLQRYYILIICPFLPPSLPLCLSHMKTPSVKQNPIITAS